MPGPTQPPNDVPTNPYPNGDGCDVPQSGGGQPPSGSGSGGVGGSGGIGGSGGLGGLVGGSKRSDRELIEGAIRAAQPRSKHSVHEDLLPPADAFPGYEVIREIHRGGQGIVYQAVQKATKRKVAIKVLHLGPFSGSKGRARFEREVSILAQLEHANIVSILDSGITSESGGKQCFYVMDYISGQTLDAFLAQSASRPIQETLSLFLKICDAVNAAHLKGITHRDLKPSNIRVDHNGEPHVLDFGLAKIVTGETLEEAQHVQMMSMTGQFIGSLPWASPEQAEGSPSKIDIRSDVYSLGVILYQLLTGGKFPYLVIGNMREVMDNILRTEPARPSTVRKQINNEVETIVLKTLQKERERRYQSAGELAKDIRRYLSGEPIEAMRESGWYMVRKTVRRHKVLVGAIVAAIAVVFLFSVYAYWNGRTLKRLADDKEAAVQQKEEALAQKIAAEETASVLRRLNGVRTLAGRDIVRTLVESNERFRNLVGATSTRELVLTKSVGYLETLKEQLKDDPAYLRDLAEANELVGDLKAGLFMPRIRKEGVTMQGAEHYAEAARLRLELLSKSPGDPDRMESAARAVRRRGDSKQTSGKHDDSLADYQQALKLFDDAISATPQGTSTDGDRRDRADSRASVILAIGDVQFILARREAEPAKADSLRKTAQGNYDAAEAYWRARVTAAPTETLPARTLGVILDKNAAVRTLDGRAQRAAAAKAIKDGKLDDAAAKVGVALGYYDEAERLATEAKKTFTDLLAANKESAELKRDLFLADHNIGTARMYKAQASAMLAAADARFADHEERAKRQHQAALIAFNEALDRTSKLATADQDNIEAQRDWAVCLNKVGNEQRDLGDLKAARDTFVKSLEIRRDILRTDPTQQYRRDVSVALFKLGELDSKEEKWKEAVARLEEAVGGFEQLVQAEVMLPTDAEFAEIRALLEDAKKKAGS